MRLGKGRVLLPLDSHKIPFLYYKLHKFYLLSGQMATPPPEEETII